MVTVLRSKLVETDFQTTLDNIVKQAMKINHAKLGNMQIVNKEKNCLEIVWHSGFKSDFIDYFKIVTMDDGSICGRAMKYGQTFFVDDVAVDKDFSPHLEVAKNAGFRTVISAPLISSHGAMIGVISTHFNLPHRGTKREVINFEKFCCQAADTIEEFLFN